VALLKSTVRALIANFLTNRREIGHLLQYAREGIVALFTFPREHGGQQMVTVKFSGLQESGIE
jgi:hypothetical protein